jgi:uncharacterized membrane protein YuzA (DUF378 family)
MSILRAISDVLLIAGGLNLGTVAVTSGKVNPIEQYTYGNQLVKNVVYGAIGVAAVYTVIDDVVHGFPHKRAEIVLLE